MVWNSSCTDITLGHDEDMLGFWLCCFNFQGPIELKSSNQRKFDTGCLHVKQ